MADRVTRVQGLRASGAAGPHDQPRPRERWDAPAGTGPECVECGHVFDRDETTDPAQELCGSCWDFGLWFLGRDSP